MLWSQRWGRAQPRIWGLDLVGPCQLMGQGWPCVPRPCIPIQGEQRATYSSNTGNRRGGCGGLWKLSHITLSSECPSTTAPQGQDNVGPIGLWSHTNLGLSPEDSSTGCVARGRPVNHSAPQLSVSKMGRLSFPCQPTSVV